MTPPAFPKTDLTVSELTVEFAGEAGPIRVVDGVSFSLSRGETLGLVGESGCGKSTIALALMGLLDDRAGARITGGSARLDGRDLLSLDEPAMRDVRGGAIGMVFQDAMAALHPLIPVGRQVMEVLRRHLGLSASEARARALELFGQVGISAPERRLKAYPHELSGGMCQRVMIAMAIACGPKVLLADEPTTALDVTVQAQIVELLAQIRQASGMAVILITHDLGVVAGSTDRVAVMYAGTIVEIAPTSALFANPSHPYTRGLLAAAPRLDLGLDEDLPTIPGNVESARTALGCRFAPRCDHALALCLEKSPPPARVSADHYAACWLTPPLLEPIP
jgi:peptide/nickel transport system ATP-binding protein